MKSRELYVSVDAHGVRAWTFPEPLKGDIVRFNANHPITAASRLRIEALTYHDAEYHTHIIQVGKNYCTFEIARDLVQEPSPKANTQGVCNTLVTDDEVFSLAVSIGRARQAEGFMIAEVLKITKWAEDIRLSCALLESVLAGNVLVSVDSKGELVFMAGDDPDDSE